ncbi:non-hydrolyzing UDP-N-acetylglucosamine 2-epimerase [Geomicrobium sp. JCM 19037]|uniref:non-hydrolyzing UDP-N-acetylglucosamine 2-epimerase n=1 Tax=Geomicrobium sp. JCM 19037 TaxID=1460634 RepID=UPI0027D7A852|nr:UDP-N-acetylglucosamine 2-epimerase (non-hydrolyzing) [Geomicrobium sp. JCM 19037]
MHGAQTARMMIEIEKLMYREKPDMMLVYGDTNSTLAGAVTAAKHHVPIVHVEAGLRSFNRQMPEEINRVITDHLSTLLFCPTDEAVRLLKKEGITNGVYQTGDIMYDAVLYYKDDAAKSDVLALQKLNAGKYYLATVHRAENTDDPKRLAAILDAFETLDAPVLFPLHPRTRKKIDSIGLRSCEQRKNMIAIHPLSYFDLLQAAASAKGILTDSGGLQKEAFMLKVPCVTLREETEWKETVTAKWNTLVTPDSQTKISEAVSRLQKPAKHPSLYGEGNAAEQMVQHMKSWTQHG